MRSSKMKLKMNKKFWISACFMCLTVVILVIILAVRRWIQPWLQSYVRSWFRPENHGDSKICSSHRRCRQVAETWTKRRYRTLSVDYGWYILPNFHFVVAFTSGGEEAVQPYRQGLLTDAIRGSYGKIFLSYPPTGANGIWCALGKLNCKFDPVWM